MNRKRKAKYMTTFPRNTVTGAPQNLRQRVSRKAALRPWPPSLLSASASSSALCPKEATGSGETGTRGPELARAHHCPLHRLSPAAQAAEQALLRVQTVQLLQVLWACP